MHLAVGDKVMHPRYGAGQITGEEHRKLVEGFEHYFVIKLVDMGATAYIPMRKMDDLGVRPVMSRAEFARVLETLGSVPRLLVKDFKLRHERIREKLATCRPIQIAEAVRDLTWRRQDAYLTKVDEDLLRQGRALLAGEIAVATDIESFDAQDAIDAALKITVASKPGRARTASATPTSTPRSLIHGLSRKVKI